VGKPTSTRERPVVDPSRRKSSPGRSCLDSLVARCSAEGHLATAEERHVPTQLVPLGVVEVVADAEREREVSAGVTALSVGADLAQHRIEGRRDECLLRALGAQELAGTGQAAQRLQELKIARRGDVGQLDVAHLCEVAQAVTRPGSYPLAPSSRRTWRSAPGGCSRRRYTCLVPGRRTAPGAIVRSRVVGFVRPNRPLVQWSGLVAPAGGISSGEAPCPAHSCYGRPMRGVADEVSARLWPGRVRAVESLAHGITNSNYRIDLGDEQVVLRVPGKDTVLLGIDRQVEIIAGRLAAFIGVAPELLAVDEPTGCLVTRFIDARPIPPAELAVDPMLGELAATLRRVHAAGTVPLVFDPFAVIHRYRDEAAGHGVPAPFDLKGALDLVDRIAAARPFRPTVLGHNDLLNANFLYDGSVRIVDWEYAGMTDPFFDLANVAVNHDFVAETERALLAHYFGEADEALVATLSLMKLVSELREAMWGVVQTAISALEVDFAAYATERASHFAALAAGYDIDELLALAAAASGRP